MLSPCGAANPETGSGSAAIWAGQDFATLPFAPEYSLAPGDFAVSFWFTKSACNNPETPFETLYSHRKSDAGPQASTAAF